ncbi:unnamed protein product, partial [Didymodactylos carnosus]
ERCLAMGMRKDLILNQEEIQRRKDSGRNRSTSSKHSSTIELTTSIPNFESVLRTFDESDHSTDLNETENILFQALTVEDLETINSVQSSFLSIVNECEDITNIADPSDHTSELIYCLQSNNKIALHIIKFCRLIDKFENINIDDRCILIKYNLILLFCISTCYISKQTNDYSLDREQEKAEEKRQMYILCNQSDYIYEMV